MSIVTPSQFDECYRCGYDLRGVADEQACPECGLLAQRSRRADDELHNTRPRWLKKLSIGLGLLLAAIFLPFGTIIFAESSSIITSNVELHLLLVFYDLAVVVAFLGIMLLTTAEGYPLADAADRKSRIRLRLAAGLPIALMITFHIQLAIALSAVDNSLMWVPIFVISSACSILPWMLFRRLRYLAGRARSAHLAEHCTIVGIGGSIGLLYIVLATSLILFFRQLGLDDNWNSRGKVSLIVMLLLIMILILFFLWSLYLIVRFAIAFWMAARKLKANWRRDDRAIET